MRLSILLVAVFAWTTNTQAQNKVGIGTTVPKYVLHIHNPSDPLSYLYITNSTTTDANAKGLLLGMQTGASYLWNFDNVPLYFGNNNSLRMQFASNGNVGIGPNFATPTYLLDVQNRMRLRGGTVNDIFTTPGIWLDDYRTTGSAGAESVFIGMQDSIRFGLYGGGTGGVGWGMNFNAKSGKVNIGGLDGSYRFNISGSDLGMALYGESNDYYGALKSNSGSFVVQSASGNSLLSTPSKPLLLNPPGSLFFTSGFVGINVSDPTARLQVAGNVLIGSGSPASGYQLSIKGKVICEEAKVQLNGAWPDYVFAASYQKPTLYQIEDYIKEHQHLPNIPSAAEIEKNGLLLGDMQKRTIEKVEELTLYLIEIKKENDLLKQRVQLLEQQKK